jgi:DNA-binding transcriptional LysR family regulator
LAETRSFTRAGVELNVTHAAISQQIRALEKWFGTPLVLRSGRKIELTETGRILARELALGFEHIQRGVTEVVEDQRERPVQITMSPAFAVKWLMPRLSEFQREHPDISLSFQPTSKLIELRPGGVDVAIRYSDARRLAREVTPVLVADMAAVAAPKLIGNTAISEPAQLLNYPWLQELGTEEVAYWFGLHRLEGKVPTTVSHMPGNLIVDAIKRGDAVSFTAMPFFEEELAKGELQAFFPLKDFGIYHLEWDTGTARPAVRTVVNWLLGQRAKEVGDNESRRQWERVSLPSLDQ